MAGWSAVQVIFGTYYLLDDGTATNNSTILRSDVAKIAGGSVGAYALTNSGDVAQIGGQEEVVIPAQWANIQDIAVGNDVLIAVLPDGTLDIISRDSQDRDDLVSGLPSITDAIAVSCSTRHALALRSNGRVVGWGDNWANKATPPSLYNAVEISAGGEHSMARRSDGTVVAWGDNWAQQCDVPAALSGVVSIAAGSDHSLAATESGDVVAWGYDYFGQASVPASVYNAAKVFASFQQSYALVPFGKVQAWGRDQYGRLGVPIELQPDPGLIESSLAFSAALSGEVQAAGVIDSTLGFKPNMSGIVTALGPIDAQLGFTADIDLEYRYKGSLAASLSFSPAVRGFQDWTSLIPLNELQEIYRLTVTGAPNDLDDLIIGGISSWQATNQAEGRSSYLQAVIPAAGGMMDALSARPNGELVIAKGYRFDDGSEQYEEILRAEFDTFRWDRGPSRFTATVSGYLAGKRSEASKRTLTGVRSLSMTNGKHRVRCDIDMFLQPGMTVTADDVTFQAGYINYYVNQTDKFCEVGER